MGLVHVIFLSSLISVSSPGLSVLVVIVYLLLRLLHRECPEELKEAVTSLIFAASRCGELPELQKIRALFTSRFGKELASRAVELRTNCGVSPKVKLNP